MKAKFLLAIPLAFSIAVAPIVSNADVGSFTSQPSTSDAGVVTPTDSNSQPQTSDAVSSDGQENPNSTPTSPTIPTQEPTSEVPTVPSVPTPTDGTQTDEPEVMTEEEYEQEILEEQFQQKMIYDLESFGTFSSSIPSENEEVVKKDEKLEQVIKNKEVREKCNVLLSTLKYDKKTGKLKCVKIKKDLSIKDIERNNARLFFVKTFEEDSNRKIDNCEVFETRDVKKVPKGYTVDAIIVCGYEQPYLLSGFVSNDGDVTLR